jgi:hypothetical protein
VGLMRSSRLGDDPEPLGTASPSAGKDFDAKEGADERIEAITGSANKEVEDDRLAIEGGAEVSGSDIWCCSADGAGLAGGGFEIGTCAKLAVTEGGSGRRDIPGSSPVDGGRSLGGGGR